MKIYEIGTGYTPIPATMGAATEIVVEELTKAFRKMGQDVQIVDIAAENRAPNDLPITEVPVPKCFRGTDVKLGLMHKLKRVVYSVSLAGTLSKILAAGNEKVIFHFHNQYNLFFFLKLVPVKLRRSCLIAYTNHSGIWRLPWEEIENTIQKRYFQEADCMKRADVVFLLNEETKRNVMKHLAVPEERLVLIKNGVNTDVYHPLSDEEKQKAKEKWGTAGKFVILQVGSVYENKGQLRAIEYLMPLMAEYPELLYAYAGGIVDEEYQKRILTLIKENTLEKQIMYLGMVSPGRELNELYNIAEATIMPSVYEGFSLVSVESLAAGSPVLVDQKGPISIGKGSVVYNPDQFSRMIKTMLINGISKHRNAARKNAEQNYSWQRIATDYQRVFENRMKEHV